MSDLVAQFDPVDTYLLVQDFNGFRPHFIVNIMLYHDSVIIQQFSKEQIYICFAMTLNQIVNHSCIEVGLTA